MPETIISFTRRGTPNNVSFLSCLFYQICPKPAHLMGVVGLERGTSWHADHAPNLPVHCCASTRQMQRTSSNNQLHEKRYTPQYIISVLCVFFKTCPKPAHLLGAVGPERDASWNVTHAPGLSVQCHTPTRQM